MSPVTLPPETESPAITSEVGWRPVEVKITAAAEGMMTSGVEGVPVTLELLPRVQLDGNTALFAAGEIGHPQYQVDGPGMWMANLSVTFPQTIANAGVPSTGRWKIAAETVERSAPQAAKAHLTSFWRIKIPVVNAIVLTCAIRARVQVEEIALGLLQDREEGWADLTYTVRTACNPTQGLAFWDYVGAKLDQWKRTLPAHEAEAVTSRLAVYVEWE